MTSIKFHQNDVVYIKGPLDLHRTLYTRYKRLECPQKREYIDVKYNTPCKIVGILPFYCGEENIYQLESECGHVQSWYYESDLMSPMPFIDD